MPPRPSIRGEALGSHTLSEFHRLYPRATGVNLDQEQWNAVEAPQGPLWILAGPGSGKTETLVARLFRFMIVDGIAPRELIICTFTNKAAENLQNRISSQLFNLKLESKIDVTDLRIGTLHSLCDSIMRDYRFENFEDCRLLNETEQFFFVRSRADVLRRETSWWTNFEGLIGRSHPTYGYNMYQKSAAIIALFNRISEDLVDETELAKSRRMPLVDLATEYSSYQEALRRQSKVDFATLQRRFLEFLSSPVGSLFIKGDPSRDRPPVRGILVDEYQDTNPIQEQIYFDIATKSGGNLTVVGDDDQALYRFRGGTVDCMVHFPRVCAERLGRKPVAVQLLGNYRSHPDIVKWFNDYISSFPEMRRENARAVGKKPVVPRSGIGGHYPAVCGIFERTAAQTATRVADVILRLKKGGRVKQFHQIALLFQSTRETRVAAGPYVSELRNKGLPVYNPRSKNFVEQPEIAALIGALIEFVDPGGRSASHIIRPVAESVTTWVAEFNTVRTDHPEIDLYFRKLEKDKQARQSGEDLGTSLRDAFYHVLALAPFKDWMEEPEKSYRIGRLSQFLDSYGAVDEDDLKMSTRAKGVLSTRWLQYSFYQRFITLLSLSRLDDVEHPDYQIVPGKIQVMTVHQAKGLEFPFVFVNSLPHSYDSTDSSYYLENLFRPFSRFKRLEFTPAQRAVHDTVRFFYVAYSRAQYGLFLIGSTTAAEQAEYAFGGTE